LYDLVAFPFVVGRPSLGRLLFLTVWALGARLVRGEG
jgi:hypothetical protein